MVTNKKNNTISTYLIQSIVICILFYIDKLIKDIDDKFTKSTGNIGYALGDLSQDWQKKLFVKVLAYTDKSGINLSSSVEVLGIALWRDKNIVFNFEKSNSKSNIINMNGNGIFDCKSHGSRSAVKINSSNSFVKFLTLIYMKMISKNQYIKNQ